MENENSGFKFTVDDERPDSLLQTRKKEETWRESTQIEALGRRLTLISLLMLCLIGVTLFAAYLHVEEKFDKMRGTESTAVQDLESKLSSLTSRYAMLEEKISFLEGVFSNLEKTTDPMAERLKKVEKNLSQMKTSQADKKELTAVIEQIEKSLEPMRKELGDLRILKDVGTEIRTLDETFAEELTKLADTTQKQFDRLNADVSGLAMEESKTSLYQLQNDISRLSSEKVGKTSLDLALEEQERRHKENLILINENLDYKESKIKSIQEKLKEIEKRLPSASKKKHHKSEKAASPKPSASFSGPVETPMSVLPESGNIVEQDIEY